MKSLTKKLTEKQAVVLYEVVQYHHHHPGQIPNAHQLALLLKSRGHEIGSSDSSARNYLNTLVKKGYLVSEGHTKKIQEEELCTEIETALCFLFILKCCTQSPEGRVPKSEVRNHLHEYFPALLPDISGIDDIIKKGIETGYLRRVTGVPEYLRVGDKITEQLPYLKMLVEEHVEISLF